MKARLHFVNGLLLAGLGQAQVVDRMVAVVNKHVILESELDQATRVEFLLQAKPIQSLTQVDRSAVLERLIDRSLLVQQRAVNQTLQHRGSVHLGQALDGFGLQQKFHTGSLIQLAFQNHVLVHHRHHAVDDLRLAESGKQQNHYEMEARLHQKVCPMLKKKLKCFSTCDEGTAGAGGAEMGKAGGFRL